MADHRGGGDLQRELLVFFYKYRLRLFLAFALPMALAVYVSFIPAPRYEATGVIVVRLGSEYVYQPETGSSASGPASVIPFNQDQMFKSEAAILGSNDLHRAVIAEIGLQVLYPELAETVEPSKFAALRQRVETWINDVADRSQTPPDRSRHKLAQAVERFRKRFSITLEKESSVITIGYQHKDPELAVKALDTLLRIYFAKRRELYYEPRSELAASEAASGRQRARSASATVDDYKRRHMIFSLEEQRTELLKRRNEAQRQLSVVINPALDREIAQINAQLNELDAKEHVYANLKKDAELAEQSYGNYARKLDEASSYDRLQRARVDSVRIIQEPFASPEAKSLQTIILLAGAVLSLVSVLLIAALSEFRRSGFLSPERIEHSLGLPVLAALPYRKRW